MRTTLLAALLETLRRNVGRGQHRPGACSRSAWSPARTRADRRAPRPGVDRPARPRTSSPRCYAAVPRPAAARRRSSLAGQRELPGWWGPGRAGRLGRRGRGRAAGRRARSGVELAVSAPTTTRPWHPGRCARLRASTARLVGHAGELHPQVRRRARPAAAHRAPPSSTSTCCIAASGGDPAGPPVLDLPGGQGGRRAGRRRRRCPAADGRGGAARRAPATCWSRCGCSTSTPAPQVGAGQQVAGVRAAVPRPGPHAHRRGGHRGAGRRGGRRRRAGTARSCAAADRCRSAPGPAARPGAGARRAAGDGRAGHRRGPGSAGTGVGAGVRRAVRRPARPLAQPLAEVAAQARGAGASRRRGGRRRPARSPRSSGRWRRSRTPSAGSTCWSTTPG